MHFLCEHFASFEPQPIEEKEILRTKDEKINKKETYSKKTNENYEKLRK